MTRADAVIDASVLGAALFTEKASAQARRFLAQDRRLIAPDLLHAEMASLAAKKIWRGEASETVGQAALRALSDFVEDFAPCRPLAARALTLAAGREVSAYDGVYLALSERTGLPLITLDEKLLRKAGAAGFQGVVRLP